MTMWEEEVETLEQVMEAPHESIILWQDDAPSGYRASLTLLKWEDELRVPTLRFQAGGRGVDVPYTWKKFPIDHECVVGTHYG